MFALVDVNSMYCACESVFRPDLKGKPIICLSNNDGCVIARSASVKPYIKMGAPYFEIQHIIKEKQVTVFFRIILCMPILVTDLWRWSLI